MAQRNRPPTYETLVTFVGMDGFGILDRHLRSYQAMLGFGAFQDVGSF